MMSRGGGKISQTFDDVIDGSLPRGTLSDSLLNHLVPPRPQTELSVAYLQFLSVNFPLPLSGELGATGRAAVPMVRKG